MNRNFYTATPNKKWATDLTELKVSGENKKLYLSAIIDLYDRYPVSHVISYRDDNRLVFKIFNKAIACKPEVKLMFHSERASQYTSKIFQKKLREKKMAQPVSKVGHCIDNAPTEEF